MRATNSGSRCPSRGKPIAARTRGATSLGPGPSRTRGDGFSGAGCAGRAGIGTAQVLSSRGAMRGGISGGTRWLELLHEGADALESGMVGTFGPFEEGGLGGRDDHAGAFKSAEGELPVDLRPRGHGVGQNLDPVAPVEQLQGGLGDADVGLDPDDRDVPDGSTD